MEITERVRQIVSEPSDVPIDKLTQDADFEQDLGLFESLEFFETIMACEEEFDIEIPDEEFDIEIPDEEAAKLTTTRKLVDYITARVEVEDVENVWPPPPSL